MIRLRHGSGSRHREPILFTFTGVQAFHGIMVRLLEVNFDKRRRESGGFRFALSQI
jgi:hypothetical protein